MLDDDESHHKHLNSQAKYAAVPAVILIIAISIYVLDPGPVSPPFSYPFQTIDCKMIEFESFNTINDTISVLLHANQAIQYQNEYLPHYLSLWTDFNGFNFKVTKKEFLRTSFTNSTINVAYVSKIAGNVNITIQCLDNTFKRFNTSILNVNSTDSDHSAKMNPDWNQGYFNNVCIENNSILFFSKSYGTGREIDFDNTSVEIKPQYWNIPSYLHFNNLSMLNDTALLAPQFDLTNWKIILFNLMPIENILEGKDLTDSKIQFMTMNNLSKSNQEYLKKYTSLNSIQIPPKACYKNLLIPETVNGDITHQDVLKALNFNFSSLKTRFFKGDIKKDSIVLANCLSNLEGMIKEQCPNCEVNILSPRIDLTKAAQIVGSSRMLIGNHISSLIYMIWMQQNSMVLDLSPKHVSCNKWAKELSTKIDIQYISLNNQDDKCLCDNFNCYPKGPGSNPEIEIELFVEQLKNALKSLNITQ